MWVIPRNSTSRATFTPELAASMTSLREASSGRPIDHVALLDAFLGRLEARIEALRGGRFDVGDWTSRQLTSGRDVDMTAPDGVVSTVRALGVDSASGALVIEERRRQLFSEGHRYNDMLRKKIPFQMGTNGVNRKGQTFSNLTCIPLPDVETRNNPNFSGG